MWQRRSIYSHIACLHRETASDQFESGWLARSIDPQQGITLTWGHREWHVVDRQGPTHFVVVVKQDYTTIFIHISTTPVLYQNNSNFKKQNKTNSFFRQFATFSGDFPYYTKRSSLVFLLFLDGPNNLMNFALLSLQWGAELGRSQLVFLKHCYHYLDRGRHLQILEIHFNHE